MYFRAVPCTHPDVLWVLPLCDPDHPQELVDVVARVANDASKNDQHIVHVQWPHDFISSALIGRHGLPHLKTQQQLNEGFKYRSRNIQAHTYQVFSVITLLWTDSKDNRRRVGSKSLGALREDKRHSSTFGSRETLWLQLTEIPHQRKKRENLRQIKNYLLCLREPLYTM